MPRIAISVNANGSPARNRAADDEARSASNVGEPANESPATSVDRHVTTNNKRLTPIRRGTVVSASGHACTATVSPSRRRNGV
jgi:hypothetical protein